jgi:hypothetical protein
LALHDSRSSLEHCHRLILRLDLWGVRDNQLEIVLRGLLFDFVDDLFVIILVPRAVRLSIVTDLFNLFGLFLDTRRQLIGLNHGVS